MPSQSCWRSTEHTALFHERVDDAQYIAGRFGAFRHYLRYFGGQFASGGLRLSLLPAGTGRRHSRRLFLPQLCPMQGSGVRARALLQYQSARRLWKPAAAIADLSGFLRDR
jgi:hypothetical protein